MDPVRPPGPLHLLERSQVVRVPLDVAFGFFSDPGNLARITPPDLGFVIRTPLPLEMRAGLEIDYRIRLLGLPLRWRSRIAAWDPPRRFVDLQLVGPYRWWHHTHDFEEVPEGTRILDRVEYALPFPPFGDLAHPLFVRPNLERIFRHRSRVIGELLEGKPPSA